MYTDVAFGGDTFRFVQQSRMHLRRVRKQGERLCILNMCVAVGLVASSHTPSVLALMYLVLTFFFSDLR